MLLDRPSALLITVLLVSALMTVFVDPRRAAQLAGVYLLVLVLLYADNGIIGGLFIQTVTTFLALVFDTVRFNEKGGKHA